MQVAKSVSIVGLHERVGKVVHDFCRSLRVFGIDLWERITIEKNGVGLGGIIDQRSLCINRELASISLRGGHEFAAPSHGAWQTNDFRAVTAILEAAEN